MKNILLVIYISMGFHAAIAQQEDSTSLLLNNRVTFGIKAGFTTSNIYGNDIRYLSSDGKTTARSGFHIGITANSMISKYFWLKHELLFTQKGADLIQSDNINGSYTSALKMYSLDLFPVNLTFHYKGFQLYAGPSLSILLGATILRKDSTGNNYIDKSPFGNDTGTGKEAQYLQKFDFGLNAGIEYEFRCGLSIGAKYNRGYTSIIDYANANTFADPKQHYSIYNQYINISIGYSFGRMHNGL